MDEASVPAANHASRRRGAPLNLAKAVALGAALGADSLSVSIGIGMTNSRLSLALQLATLFGATQGALLAGGAALAAALHSWLENMAQSPGALAGVMCRVDPGCVQTAIHAALSLIGAAIVGLIGVNLIRNYLMPGEGTTVSYYRGPAALALLTLSVSTDALSAGVGLGMLEGLALTRTSVVVSVVIFAMAIVGLRTGRRIGRLVGRKAEPVGGLMLILIAIHFVLQAW